MKQFLKNNIPIIVLFLTSLVLCLCNYSPGTFLTGWDTLHPEFNFELNFSRVIFGVFRSEQGLGAVAGHSHMVEIIRIILLYIFHFFLPLDFLRYSYIFLCLISGPIGMYFFLKRCVFTGPQAKIAKHGAFIGALFYLLNLGTIQIFSVPFEMFTTQYATLPWIFLFATKYLTSNKEPRITNHEISRRKLLKIGNLKFGIRNSTLLLFSIATILAAPMAYAATLWYVQFLVFVVYIVAVSYIGNLELEIRNWKFLKRPLVLILITLLLNLYWILPNIYFVLHHGSEVPQANINKLFSDEAFLHNKEFGNIQHIALLKTFYFDWDVYTGNNNYDNLLAPWIAYMQNPFIAAIGILFAIIALLGIIYTFLRKNSIGISLLPILLICLFFLINDNSLQSWLYEFLQQHIPLFKEALRFPDDKILGVFVFVFTVFFSLGQMWVFKFLRLPLRKNHESRIMNYGVFTYIFLILNSCFIILYMFPAFQGQLISPYIRVTIPKEYFQMDDWFNSQKDAGRIASLPIQSLWGWVYYDWYGNNAPSYQGAGFIWFGVKQPVLDRDFDRWSPYNEQYYREMSYAVYAQRPDALLQLLKKYDIHYLLLDTSIIPPQQDKTVLYIDQIKKLLSQESQVRRVATFGNHLFVYHVENQPVSPITVFSSKLPHINQQQETIDMDRAYMAYNDYVTDTHSADITYPYQQSVSNENTLDTQRITQSNNTLSFALPQIQRIIPQQIQTYQTSETTIPANITVQVQHNNLQLIITPQLLNHPLKKAVAQIPLLPSDTNIMFSINKTYTYTVPVQTQYPIDIQNISLYTRQDNTINFYRPTKPTQLQNITSGNFSTVPCGQSDTGQSFGFNPTSTGFSLLLNHTEVCSFIPLKQLANQQTSLIHLSFNYQGQSPLYTCLVQKVTDDCIQGTEKQTNASGIVDGLWELTGNDIAHDLIKLYSDSHNTNQTVSFTGFSIDQSQAFSTSVFSSTLLQTILAATAPITGSDISIPASSTNTLTSLAPTRENGCQSNFFASSIPNSRADIVKTTTNQYISYTSSSGIFCDHFSYSNASHDQEYVVGVTARSITGLPLHVCIVNRYSQHCDITAIVNKSKNFTTTYFLLPALEDHAMGYDVDISNIGIPGSPSKNDLASVTMTPVPYNWLASLTNTPPSTTQKPQIIQAASQQLNPDTYLVSLKAKTNTQNTVVLSESYEQSWHAYMLSQHPSWIATQLPFLFGKEITNHVLVNGWENGWETNRDSQNIAIVFIPQYLEFLGFGIFITIIIIIMLIPI